MALPIGNMHSADRKRIEVVAVASRIHLANAKVDSRQVSVHDMIEDAGRILDFYNNRKEDKT